MSDIATFQQLCDYDIKQLPDRVLQMMYLAIRDERNRRKVRNRDQVQVVASAGEVWAKKFGHAIQRKEFIRSWLQLLLPELLNQDWSYLFPPTADPDPKYYVYAHAFPSGAPKPLRFVHNGVMLKMDGLPFYVGKGCGERAYDLKRNQGHGETLRQLLNAGASPSGIVHILASGLMEAKALELESKLICFFGTRYESGRAGILVNLDIPPRPSILQEYF